MKNKWQFMAIVAMLGFITLSCDMGTSNSGPPRPGDTIVNSLGMTMVWIPPGTFTMGSPETEIGRFGEGFGFVNREIQREITLSYGFWMSIHPVTQGQHITLMGLNPSYFGFGDANPYQPDLDEPRLTPGDNPELRPVERVSWYAALVFANRLSIREGLTPAYRIRGSTNPADWGPVPSGPNADWDAVELVPGATGYRLPTEAQWEYAARAGTTTAFNDGITEDWADEEALASLGWFGFNSNRMTRQVGLRPPNAWGLYDMHGNVFDWVWDWFEEYEEGNLTDPTGALTGTQRVFRGGAWNPSGRSARSAHRVGSLPHMGQYFNGIRLVRP